MRANPISTIVKEYKISSKLLGFRISQIFMSGPAGWPEPQPGTQTVSVIPLAGSVDSYTREREIKRAASEKIVSKPFIVLLNCFCLVGGGGRLPAGPRLRHPLLVAGRGLAARARPVKTLLDPATYGSRWVSLTRIAPSG